MFKLELECKCCKIIIGIALGIIQFFFRILYEERFEKNF